MKKLSRGMVKDTALVDQPEGTMRDALNANLNITKGSIANEYGTTLYINNQDFIVYGKAVLDDDRIVLFGQEKVDTTYTEQIRILNTRNQEVFILYEDTNLNFKESHPIVCVSRKNQANEYLVYFTDGYRKEQEEYPGYSRVVENNPPRVINVTRQLEWRQSGGLVTQLYNTIDDYTKLELVPRVGPHSTIDSAEIQEGGSLKSAAYYLCLSYADNDGLETNYFVVANPVYIVPGAENSLPTNVLIGAEGGTPTNKSIAWTITVPDEVSYNLLQPSVIRLINQEQTAFKLPPVKANTGGTVKFVYTGNEQALPISPEDILVDDVRYTSAEAIAQLDNRLYLGNVTAGRDIGFQPFAHNIEIVCKRENVNNFNPRVFDTYIVNQGYASMMQLFDLKVGTQFRKGWTYDAASGYTAQDNASWVSGYAEALKDIMLDPATGDSLKGYRSPKYSFKKKSYRRGEVYAFYISFVLKDGTETYAYHIPGRTARSMIGNGGIKENFGLDLGTPGSMKDATGFRPEEFLASAPNAKVYQVVDTSQKVVNTDTQTMAFWENENEEYPNTLDFVKGQVEADGSILYDLNDSLAGTNVRHHRFPTNLGPQTFVERAVGTNPNYQEQIGKLPEAGGGFTYSSTTASGGYGNGFVMGEKIRLLGIEVKKLRLPKYILEQVQGFKIYYAKRTTENKTILGQGVAVPGHPRYATVNKQNLAEAVSGPYKRAFYMYGGLDHTDNSTVYTLGNWKGNGSIGDKDYFAHPVFKFHDFTLLRKRDDLSAATHIQCQYGVIFRMYQGGPGNYVPSCSYDQLYDAPSKDAVEEGNYTGFNEVARSDQHTTTFPSNGWISPDLRNTVDFYWHDPLHLGSNLDNYDTELYGVTRILDISDVIEGEAGESEGDTAKEEKKARSKNFRKGNNLVQPAEDEALQGGNGADTAARLLEVEAKARKIRAWYTSMLLASTYIAPSKVLANDYIIKGGAYKEMNPQTGSSFLGSTRFYSEGNFDDNQLTLNIEAGGRILLKGKEDYTSDDAASFKGANYLYNRAGETSHVLSLVSGLPALRGHLPFFSNSATLNNSGVRVGLTTWGDANKWLYPDAPTSGIPVYFQQYGNGRGPTDHYTYDGSGFSDLIAKEDPENFRGLKYTMGLSDQFDGLPMAWLINVCAFRTDVYTPFDQQQLVWTGFYQRIEDANLESGAATDGDGSTQNYYAGNYASGNIFGGDTYIVRHGVRMTSQSYGHAFFRAAQNLNDPVAGSMAVDNAGVPEDEGLATYLNNAVTTKKDRYQGDIPTNLNPLLRGSSNNNTRFGTTNGNPIWNWARDAAGDASESDSYQAAVRSLNVIQDTWNWVRGNNNPVSTLLYYYCESDDLIEFRHVKDVEKGEETKVFDYNTAASLIFEPPTTDYTDPDKLLYSEHFSSLQDIKVTQPLPVFAELVKESTFPRRVVRSDIDSGSLADGYRKFRALEFKDIPSQRGDIKSLFDYRGVLYIHTDRSLFLTQGKEELSIGAANAFIGSGDIFTQDPSEVQETSVGYGGTSSRHCNVTTKHGHFYLNYRDRKIYMAGGQGIQDVSPGMEVWLRDNMPFTLESYGINLDSPSAETNGFFTDASTARTVAIGFTMGYDPVFDRILITKREPVPTQAFIDEFTAGTIVISNNIPVIIDAGDANCTEITVEDDIATDLSRQKNKDDEGELADPVEIFCGPISFGNPKYFKQEGWTLSYYPSAKVWGSRHSYLPSLYAHTSEHMVSFSRGFKADGTEFWGSWEHSNKKNPGRFYGKTYNFEIEYIDNTAQAEPKVYSTINYWAESFLEDSKNIKESLRITNPVFDKYYAYNSTQITGQPATINYLNNARLIDRIWSINELRDYAKTEDIREGELITNTENVAGYITSNVTSHIQTETMFEEEGVVNSNYVDTNKEWYNRRKLVDHFLGVRLIHDNSNRNLVHLYAVGTKFRKSYR